jgi:hypothetical protein
MEQKKIPNRDSSKIGLYFPSPTGTELLDALFPTFDLPLALGPDFDDPSPGSDLPSASGSEFRSASGSELILAIVFVINFLTAFSSAPTFLVDVMFTWLDV